MSFREVLTNVNDNDIWEIDNTTDPLIEYWGYAQPGSSTSASVWKMIKLTKDANGLMIRKQFANGSPAYAHAFANRTTFTYS